MNPAISDIVRPLTPMSVRLEQVESIATQVPLNNPWNLLKSLSKASTEEIRSSGSVFTFAEEIAKGVGDGEEVTQSFEEHVEDNQSGSYETASKERAKGFLLQPRKSLVRRDSDRMLGNHVTAKLDYSLSPNLNYYIDPIESNDVRRFSSPENSLPSRFSHHPSKKQLSSKGSSLNIEGNESTSDYYLQPPSSYDTTKNLSPLSYRFAQSTASSQLKVKSRATPTNPHNVFSSPSVRSRSPSLMRGVTRESPRQNPQQRIRVPETTRQTTNGNYFTHGNYFNEIDDTPSIMNNHRPNYIEREPVTSSPQYSQLPPEYPRATDAMSQRTALHAKELLSPDEPEFDVLSSFGGKSRSLTITKPQLQFLQEQRRMQMHEAHALLSPNNEEIGKISLEHHHNSKSIAFLPQPSTMVLEDPEESISVASRIRQFSGKQIK